MSTGEVIALAFGAAGILGLVVGAISLRPRRRAESSSAIEEVRKTLSDRSDESPDPAYAPEPACAPEPAPEAAPEPALQVPSGAWSIEPRDSRVKRLRRRVTSLGSPHARNVGARDSRPIPNLMLVDCTVFAPLSVARDHWMLVQVYLHEPGQADDVAALAAEVDVETTRRAVGDLLEPLATGTVIDVELEMPGLMIAETEQRLVWRARPTAASFSVKPPTGHPLGRTPGVVIVRAEGIPLRRLAFQVTVERKARPAAKLEAQPADDVRFRSAFVSYASADRSEVVARAQILTAAGITYFQDVLSLDPGERWKREIYRRIDDCELFLLFWSKSAKRSEWVRREARHAMTQRELNQLRLPEIRPVILPPPPVERPWPELAHLHFNDRLLCPSLARIEEHQR